MHSESPPSGSGDLFGPLTRESSLVDRVSDQFEALIISGKLHPGDALPSEAHLARLMGVSRTVVREACSRLGARHLLETQEGKLIVSAPTAKSVGRSMALMLQLGQGELDHEKVLEVRRLLEVEIARLAALRRTPDDLASLKEIMDEASGIPHDAVRFPALDVAFHRGLALATQNPLFVVLLDALADTLMAVRRIAYQVPGMPARSLSHHQSIYDQVAAGSTVGAANAMLNHLIEAEGTVKEAQEAARTISTEILQGEKGPNA